MRSFLKDKDIVILIIVILVIIVGIITLAFVINRNQKENEKASEQRKQEFEQYIENLHKEREDIDKKAQEKIDFLDNLNSENAAQMIVKLENLGYSFYYNEDAEYNYKKVGFHNEDATIFIDFITLVLDDSTTLEMSFHQHPEYYCFYKNYYTEGLNDDPLNSENGLKLYSNWLKEINITQDELTNLLFCAKLMKYETK